jgi:hypothetical protein
MDWVNQNKVRNWLIVVLVVINLLTVSILWMQTARTNEPQPQQSDARASESVALLKKTLDLNEGQTKQFDSMRTGQIEKSKSYNDRLAALKRQLSEELFKEHPDTSLVHSLTGNIGELQSKVEQIRFDYFKDLLALCTPEQREKLRPIVTEIFGRKPPREEQQVKAPRNDRTEMAPPREQKTPENKDRRQPPEDEKPKPPTVDEKLSKLSEKLQLRNDQAQKIREVLSNIMKEGQNLRKRVNPDKKEIESEKEQLRKKEDEAILKVLDENQKREYHRMISNRRK